jgi:hypothetical protein
MFQYLNGKRVNEISFNCIADTWKTDRAIFRFDVPANSSAGPYNFTQAKIYKIDVELKKTLELFKGKRIRLYSYSSPKQKIRQSKELEDEGLEMEKLATYEFEASISTQFSLTKVK